jgi:Mrp family chromosome partitioning ATPase
MTGIALAMTGDPHEIQSLAALTQAGLEVAHRCRDVAEVLGLARAGRLRLVLTAPVLAWDAELIAELRGLGVQCIALVDSDSQEQRWRALGVRSTIDVSQPTWPDHLSSTVRRVLTEPVAPDHKGAEVVPLGSRQPRSDPSLTDPGLAGKFVAVWGPIGSPGRSQISTALAYAWADHGARVLLIDADTYGASLHHQFALPDAHGSGLLEVCRDARHGQLTTQSLVDASRKVAPHLALLPGVSHSLRWAEVGAAALDVLWQRAREVCDVVVVDTGFCLEHDQSDVAITRMIGNRNVATLSALQEADSIVAVGQTGVAALERLARGIERGRRCRAHRCCGQ